MFPSTLYRAAALTGMACAVLLLTNAARRADLLPENALTHAIAPLAALAGLFALTGLNSLLPEAIYLAGFAISAVSIAWLSVTLYTTATDATRTRPSIL